MVPILDRRKFLALATLALLPRWLPRSGTAPVHIALIYAPEFADVRAGALMSAAEAQRAATLLRRDFHFTTIPAAEYSAAALSGVTAVIVALTEPIALPGMLPIIDAAGAAPRRCAANVYHLMPTACTVQHATADVPDAEAVIWHAGLERFGAGQLNARFAAAQVEGTAPAWAGWFAVKALWESQLRGTALADGSFDGHKGQALVFSKLSHALQQPLYLLRNSDGEPFGEWSPPEDYQDAPCDAS